MTAVRPYDRDAIAIVKEYEQFRGKYPVAAGFSLPFATAAI